VSTISPNRTTIVRATEKDLPSVAALASLIWRACYREIISTEQIEYMLERMYRVETMREEIRHEGIRYERLFVDDRFIGFASYGPFGEPGTFKLHKLYLRPAQHHRGLGSLLLRHCETEAHQAGGRRLILNVNKQNSRAIAVYLRNDFRISDSVMVDIGGGFVMDDYVMEKELQRET
jgi:ribosomal protein S18 acetylase RimI-like enzyme